MVLSTCGEDPRSYLPQRTNPRRQCGQRCSRGHQSSHCKSIQIVSVCCHLRLKHTLQAQCISNLTDVLKAAGSSWDKVVKVNVYLKSMDDYAAMNEEYIKVCHIHPILELSHQQYSQLLPVPKPARTCIQAGKLPYDVDIEIEAIAAA